MEAWWWSTDINDVVNQNTDSDNSSSSSSSSSSSNVGVDVDVGEYGYLYGIGVGVDVGICMGILVFPSIPSYPFLKRDDNRINVIEHAN
ncbi:hypothetical protein U3516DRAFT_737964 [Neocallimastix sp. 'constans']